MRIIALVLFVLLVMIQYPLWLGHGGWLRVWDMRRQVEVAHQKIADLKARNTKLASEVSDLKEGTDAVEERARFELGMLKNDEVYIQLLQANAIQGASDAVVPVTTDAVKLHSPSLHSSP
jgi:cell division protein FtsB